MHHQVLDQYPSEYKSHYATFRGATTFPQFIQQKEEIRPYSKREIRGNRFLLSTFDGNTLARAWVKKLEAFFLLHPVAEKEAVEIAALHMEGEASVWWFKTLVHSSVRSFEDFSQGLIQTFDGERTKEEQPFLAMEEATMALEEATATATQEDPRIHQGMSEVPLFISANKLKNCGNSSLKVPGSTYFAIPGHQDCIALC